MTAACGVWIRQRLLLLLLLAWVPACSGDTLPRPPACMMLLLLLLAAACLPPGGAGAHPRALALALSAPHVP
jgi:hypothetical protein